MSIPTSLPAKSRHGQIRELFRSAAGIVLLALVSLTPLGTGCSSPEERALYHIERGREFAAVGKDAAAIIEFRTAFSFDSQSLTALTELANTAEKKENRHDFRFYLRQMLTIDPNDDASAIRLAISLRDDDPLQARKLIYTAVAHDPLNAANQLVLSKVELSFKRIDEALSIVKRAIELDPTDPDAHWHLGIVYEVMLRQDMLEGKLIDEALRSNAVDAFDQFIEAGGQPEWNARFEQARILATGPHNLEKALTSARLALASARKTNEDAPKLATARHLASLARVQQNLDAHAEAVDALLEITPRDFRAWKQLAGLREASGKSADAVYQQLIALFPNDPEVHILFARHLGRTQGYMKATGYFNKQIDRGIDPPRMLSGLRSYQTTKYRHANARSTLVRLQRDFPDSPWTELELARKLALEAKTLPAIAALESLLRDKEISEAFEMLAKLERFHQRKRKAVLSARKAVETKGYYEPGLHRLYAETLFEVGKFAKHLTALGEIEQYGELTSKQNLLKAKSLYETGKGEKGRAALLELVQDPTTSTEATLEYVRRELGHPKQQRRIRKLLAAAMANDPKNRELVAMQIYLNLEAGQQERAFRMLEGLAIAKYPPDLQALRAHLRATRGDLAGALKDANLALRADPLLPKLIDFALYLYSQDDQMGPHLARIEHWIEQMRVELGVEWLVNSRRIARLHLLRSHMLRFEGRHAEALEILESALANHEYTIDIRIAHANLVALTADDLDRAIEIASQIVDRHGANPLALNALGFAYLRADKPFQALEFLRLANQKSVSPNPRLLFHESIALRLLGHKAEALELIDETLALDPSFPQAAEERQSLLSAINGEAQDS